jgi:hypothetical protein
MSESQKIFVVNKNHKPLQLILKINGFKTLKVSKDGYGIAYYSDKLLTR